MVWQRRWSEATTRDALRSPTAGKLSSASRSISLPHVSQDSNFIKSLSWNSHVSPINDATRLLAESAQLGADEGVAV